MANSLAIFKGMHDYADEVRNVADALNIPDLPGLPDRVVVDAVLIELSRDLRAIKPDVVPDQAVRAEMHRVIRRSLTDLKHFRNLFYDAGQDDIADALWDVVVTVYSDLSGITY